MVDCEPGANFDVAWLCDTIFVDIDLHMVNGDSS